MSLPPENTRLFTTFLSTLLTQEAEGNAALLDAWDFSIKVPVLVSRPAYASSLSTHSSETQEPVLSMQSLFDMIEKMPSITEEHALRIMTLERLNAATQKVQTSEAFTNDATPTVTTYMKKEGDAHVEWERDPWIRLMMVALARGWTKAATVWLAMEVPNKTQRLRHELFPSLVTPRATYSYPPRLLEKLLSSPWSLEEKKKWWALCSTHALSAGYDAAALKKAAQTSLTRLLQCATEGDVPWLSHAEHLEGVWVPENAEEIWSRATLNPDCITQLWQSARLKEEQDHVTWRSARLFYWFQKMYRLKTSDADHALGNTHEQAVCKTSRLLNNLRITLTSLPKYKEEEIEERLALEMSQVMQSHMQSPLNSKEWNKALSLFLSLARLKGKTPESAACVTHLLPTTPLPFAATASELRFLLALCTPGEEAHERFLSERLSTLGGYDHQLLIKLDEPASHYDIKEVRQALREKGQLLCLGALQKSPMRLTAQSARVWLETIYDKQGHIASACSRILEAWHLKDELREGKKSVSVLLSSRPRL